MIIDILTLVCSILAIITAIIAAVFSLVAIVDVRSLKNSTHSIQWVPAGGPDDVALDRQIGNAEKKAMEADADELMEMMEGIN